jgi:hypothetical protein
VPRVFQRLLAESRPPEEAGRAIPRQAEATVEAPAPAPFTPLERALQADLPELARPQLHRLADRVVEVIDQRIVAHRERTGRNF